uniref:SET104 n=1 Tax=Arundo donax TaxID=35708 RepID=A0A0A9GZD8_ARUDO
MVRVPSAPCGNTFHYHCCQHLTLCNLWLLCRSHWQPHLPCYTVLQCGKQNLPTHHFLPGPPTCYLKRKNHCSLTQFHSQTSSNPQKRNSPLRHCSQPP